MTLWKVCSVAVGLWASTALPGIGLGGGPPWRQAASFLTMAALFGVLWGLAELGYRLVRAMRAWLGQRVALTWEHSLASPALTGLIPGSGTVLDVDVEVTGEPVEKLGLLLKQLLAVAVALVVLVLEFWAAGWLTAWLGLGFQIAGFWSAVAGCAVVVVGYLALMSVVGAVRGLAAQIPRIKRARAAADQCYQDALAAGLDTETARVKARATYDQTLRDQKSPKSHSPAERGSS